MEIFPLDDFSQHAYYVIDLLFQRQQRQFWNSLFDAARDQMHQKQWEEAQDCLQKALQIGKTLNSETDASVIRQRAGFDLLMGACYLGQGKLDEAIRYYDYAVATFVEGADDYGHAIFLYARGLALHAKKDWHNAYITYKKAWALLERPFVYDDAMRHMRVDLEYQIKQVQNELFPKVTSQPRAQPPVANVQDAAPIKTTLDAEQGKPIIDSKVRNPNLPTDTDTRSRANFAVAEGFLRLFPFYQDVSAGPGIWLQEYKSVEKFLEIEHLSIDGEAYRIKPLTSTGSRMLQLQRNTDYGAFHVVGDSMNKSDILPGDYVLAEHVGSIPSTDFNNNIICALLYPHTHDELVVKRFSFDNNVVTLISENIEEKYESKTYRKSEVAVLGKVVAILKKIG